MFSDSIFKRNILIRFNAILKFYSTNVSLLNTPKKGNFYNFLFFTINK